MSQDAITLGDVIVNNPDSYPYDLSNEGYYLAQQYFLAWYYGAEAYNRLDAQTMSHNSYLVPKLHSMMKDGVDLSGLTVDEMDQMAFDNASLWFKIDTIALAAYTTYSAYTYAKSVKTATSTPGGAQRAAQYSSEWSNASLNDAIDNFAPNATPVKTSTGKMIYSNPDTGINIVHDVTGNYFRIENTNITGARRYLDINGNTLYNKVVDGRTIGIPKTEYQQLTHYNNLP